ncbi:hypothetical protein V5799_018431 [Amblyomma americanum]|uniref:Major facilitator superfamily (MFS) profile domain-containing protein n=1 Tax=Amblyomma americanum TaxID=6943 RepID=A0AAQ4EZJ1_AMBAM
MPSEVDDLAELLLTTATKMAVPPEAPTTLQPVQTAPDVKVHAKPQTSVGYDVHQPAPSVGTKSEMCRPNTYCEQPVLSPASVDVSGSCKYTCRCIQNHRRKPRLSKDQPLSCPPSSEDYGASLPMLSPGAATLLNIDKALAPKGPSPLPAELYLGHGRFQLMILACAQLSVAVDAYQRLSARLLAPPVDHWCRPPEEYAHMSTELWRNVGVPLGSDGRYNQCAIYEQPFVDRQHSHKRSVVPCNEWDYDLTPGVQTVVSRWNLVCEKAWQVTLVAVYNILSGSVMLPLAGQLSDKVGRRNVINVCVILAMCAGLATSYASSFVAFVVSRLFVGASLSALHANTMVLLFELVTPSNRDLYCSIAHFGFVVGSVVASALEGLVLDVQIVEAVAIMPASLLVVCLYAVEDSPMWLLATWNFDRAKKSLLWISRINGVTVVSLDTPGLEQQYKLKQTEEQPLLHRVSVLDMLINEYLRKRVCLMMCVWFCLLFAMQGVWQHTPRHTDFWLLLTAVVPRTAALPAAYTLLRSSSRKAALGMCVALSCCLSFGLAFLTLLAPPKNKNVVTLFCELTLSSLVMAYTVVILHSLEMFPTVLRTMAVCTVLSVGRIGAALSAGIEAAAERLHRSVPLFLGALSLVVVQVVLVSLPETKYSQLPNTLYDLEADVVKHVVLDILQNSTQNATVEATKTNSTEGN